MLLVRTPKSRSRLALPRQGQRLGASVDEYYEGALAGTAAAKAGTRSWTLPGSTASAGTRCRLSSDRHGLRCCRCHWIRLGADNGLRCAPQCSSRPAWPPKGGLQPERQWPGWHSLSAAPLAMPRFELQQQQRAAAARPARSVLQASEPLGQGGVLQREQHGGRGGGHQRLPGSGARRCGQRHQQRRHHHAR
jgi:hypothetical protein